jgi:lysozyme
MRERIAPVLLSLSAAGLVAIAMHEGYRDRAYDDGIGVQTLGFGATKREDGTPVQRGDTTTPERALAKLAADADEHAQAVLRCAPVPMHEHEFSAFVSLTFNVGASAFCRSTAARKLREGDYAGACAEILRWTYAGGVQLRGLVIRRQREYSQCMSQ